MKAEWDPEGSWYFGKAPGNLALFEVKQQLDILGVTRSLPEVGGFAG